MFRTLLARKTPQQRMSEFFATTLSRPMRETVTAAGFTPDYKGAVQMILADYSVRTKGQPQNLIESLEISRLSPSALSPTPTAVQRLTEGTDEQIAQKMAQLEAVMEQLKGFYVGEGQAVLRAGDTMIAQGGDGVKALDLIHEQGQVPQLIEFAQLLEQMREDLEIANKGITGYMSKILKRAR